MKVNLANLVEVLQNVTDVYRLGLHLDVDKSVLNRIRKDFRMTDDQMVEMLQYWLSNDLRPTWNRLISALKAMNRKKLAAAVTTVSKRESLHEPPREESQRWEGNLKIIVTLEKKLGQLQQHSGHMNNEWEKSEKKWCEYLETKGQKVATKALVKPGPSHECKSDVESQNNSELLYQCSELTQDVEQHVKRKRELRGFCERATEHQCELQQTEMELNKLKEGLGELDEELEQRIDQLEELGGVFLEEANKCREWLQKSKKQQETCEKKINESRKELDKQQEQLQKIQKELEKFKEILKKRRDELVDSHSKTTQYLEELETKSNNLSDEVERKQALPATNFGLSVGGLFGHKLLGGVAGFVVDIFADESEHKAISEMISEEEREKLHRCETERKKCAEVVKKCEEVLTNSDEELTEHSELEQTFSRQ